MNIVPFNFEESSIRVVVAEDNSILFVAKDVASTLGYVNTRDAVINNCKRAKSLKDIGVASSDSLDPQTKLIPESDVYRLTMKSTLERAERFQDWVVEEVLPSIRKTGGYHHQAAVNNQAVGYTPDIEIQLVEATARMLRLSDTSKLRMISQVYKEKGLSTLCLPTYVQQPLARSLTHLLKSRGSSINARVANLALVDMGFLVEETRTGQSGTTKKFKSITDQAAIFGHNEVNPNAPRESQPLYHESKFDELLDLIVEHLAQDE